MTRRRLLKTLMLATVLGARMANAGDLNPPAGPIGPTMKPLSEIEPRTAVNATNTPGDADSLFVISQPGSYYLANYITGESAKNGIKITADNVTLDLNGFALIGVAGSLDGVAVPSVQVSVAVRNGTIRAWASKGVAGGPAKYALLENLRAYNNGQTGLQVGDGGVITTCIAGQNGGDGINAGTGASISNCTSCDNTGRGILGTFGTQISGCSAYSNSGSGIWSGQGSLVAKCAAYANGNTGIEVDMLGTVTNSTASDNTNDGIHAGDGSTVSNCTASDNSDDGINVDSGCLVLGCTAYDNVGSGFYTNDSTSRIEGNHAARNNIGFEVTAGGNLIVKNSASQNAANNYVLGANHYGQIVVSPGGGFTDYSAWANFQY